MVANFGHGDDEGKPEMAYEGARKRAEAAESVERLLAERVGGGNVFELEVERLLAEGGGGGNVFELEVEVEVEVEGQSESVKRGLPGGGSGGTELAFDVIAESKAEEE